MSRSKLIDACLNLQKAVSKQLIKNHQIPCNTDFVCVQNMTNKGIIEYICKLTVIGKHPEYYHLRK